MNDYELEQIFKRNRPEMPTEPGFQREVWKKIERRSEMMSLPWLMKSASDFVMRPAVGFPLAAAAIALSALLAVHNGAESRDETWTELSFNYNQLINPISHYK